MKRLTLDDLPSIDDMPEGFYERYDNYDAIEVPKIALIPIDYWEPMGVPITIFDRKDFLAHMEIICMIRPKIHGQAKYNRIIVRWIWAEQHFAITKKQPLIVKGAYHSLFQWCEAWGVELIINDKKSSQA